MCYHGCCESGEVRVRPSARVNRALAVAKQQDVVSKNEVNFFDIFLFLYSVVV